MNIKITHKARLDKIKKDGSVILFLRASANREKIDISSNISILPIKDFKVENIIKQPTSKRAEYYSWNTSTERLEKLHPDYEYINYQLSKERIRAIEIIRNYQTRNKILSLDQFKKEFLKVSDIKLNAFQYFTKELENRKPYYAFETYRTYKGMLTKFNDFAPNISIHDIDYKLLVKYENYMLSSENDGGKANDETTVQNTFKVLRTFVNFALKSGDIQEEHDPFKNYNFKISKGGKKRRSFLEPNEIEKLEHLYNIYRPLEKPIERVSPEEWKSRENNDMLTPAEYEVVRYFLYSCYTGLRFKDIQKHNYSEIKTKLVENLTTKSQKEKHYLDVDLHKTGANIIIPLVEKAVKLIDTNQKEGLVFNPISNQKTNQHLKEIIKKVQNPVLLTT